MAATRGRAIRLTGDFRDYSQVLLSAAEMVITKGGKVVKEREGGRYHRQATKAELDAAEPVDP